MQSQTAEAEIRNPIIYFCNRRFGFNVKRIGKVTMKKHLLFALAVLGLTAGGAFAQEFTNVPKAAPQPVPPRPAIEEGSNSSILHKVFTAPRKYQLVNPGAPASYGSGQQVVVADSRDASGRPATDPRDTSGKQTLYWKVLSIPF